MDTTDPPFSGSPGWKELNRSLEQERAANLYARKICFPAFSLLMLSMEVKTETQMTGRSGFGWTGLVLQ